MECLNEIIGLFENDCDCITKGLSSEEIKELTTSKSGLFIDTDLNGAINLQALNSESSCKNMITYFKNGKNAAVKKFEADILAGITQKYTDAGGNYNGLLGKPSHVGDLNVYKDFQYFKMKAVQPSDADITIKNVRIGVSKSAIIEVHIIRVAQGETTAEIVETKTAQSNAGMFVQIEFNAHLPITFDGRTYDYYIVWERPDGVFPFDTKADCDCGGNRTYQNFISISGGEVDTLGQLYNGKETSFSHGIIVDVEIRCKTNKLICRDYKNRDAISVTTAWAILYSTAANIIDAILMNTEINRYTTMNREAMYGLRNHFRKEYNTRMIYLTETINVTSSDCFICKQGRIFVTTIES